MSTVVVEGTMMEALGMFGARCLNFASSVRTCTAAAILARQAVKCSVRCPWAMLMLHCLASVTSRAEHVFDRSCAPARARRASVDRSMVSRRCVYSNEYWMFPAKWGSRPPSRRPDTRSTPAGTCLASCSGDKTVRLWEKLPDTGQWYCKTVLQETHSKTVRGVAWSPGGRSLATASFDGTTAIWNRTPIGWDQVCEPVRHAAARASAVSSVRC